MTSITICRAQLAPRPIPVPGVSSVQVTIENEGMPGEDPAGRLEQIIAQYEQKLGKALAGDPPKVSHGPGSTYAAAIRRFGSDKNTIHAFLTGSQGGGVCHVQGSGVRAVMSLKAALQQCGVELKQQAPLAQATPPAFSPEQRQPPQVAAGEYPPGKAAAKPLHPENWSLVQGVYFRSTSGVGVGGMVIMDYEPLVLFQDGTYFEIDEAALEDIDLAAEKQVKPKRWGRWRQSGDVFSLTDYGEKPHSYRLQDGSLFQAFAAEADGNRLTGTYKRVSGGGNSALGGEVMVAISSQMQFKENGQFLTDNSVGAMNSGSQSGVGSTVGSHRKMAMPGVYELHHHTVTLHYPNGTVKRSFFAFGSQKTPARIDKDMIFIGDRTFVID